MKKTTIAINNESFNLYFGISSVYGEFILETGGDPTCLNELEDSDSCDLIDSINSIIDDPNTAWEDCSEDDERYVTEWLNIWDRTIKKCVICGKEFKSHSSDKVVACSPESHSERARKNNK